MKRKVIGPSKRQLEVYDFIVDFMKDKGYSPTVREICNGVGLESSSSAHAHLKALVDWKLITYIPQWPRTIALKGYKLMRNENG